MANETYWCYDIDATISDKDRVTGSVKMRVGKMNGKNFIRVLVPPISELILLLENKDGQFSGEEFWHSFKMWSSWGSQLLIL